ncbi:PAS fold family [Verrucomicrobiia bacterium DG1235]|nr:PAS fold family [Verrucomicrobiae bacterium DG1235]
MNLLLKSLPKFSWFVYFVFALLLSFIFEAAIGEAVGLAWLRLSFYGVLCVPLLSVWWLLRGQGRGDSAGDGVNFEEQFRITLSSIGDAVMATDLEGRVTLMNDVAVEMTGWSREEAYGQPLAEVFHIVNTKSRERCANPVELVLSSGKIVGLANHTSLLSKSGKEYFIADSGAPIRDDAGDLRGVVLVFSDVTEAYRLREAIEKSEERLQLALAATQEGVWELNNVTGTIFVSPRVYEIVGLEPDENEVKAESWLELIHPDDSKMVSERVRDLFAGTSVVGEWEYRVMHADGRYRWVRSRTKGVETKDGGHSYRFVGVLEDITESKEAHLALEESQLRLRSAQEAGGIGVYEIDLQTQEITVSPELGKLFGRDKLVFPLAEGKGHLHPDDRDWVEAEMAEAMAGESEYCLEYRMIHGETNEARWVEVHGGISRDPSGEPRKTTGTIVDITDRVLDRERLLSLNSVLNAIREVNQLMTRERDAQVLIEKAVNILVDTSGFVTAWIYLCDSVGNRKGFIGAGFEDSQGDLEDKLIGENGPYILESSLVEGGIFAAPFPPPDRPKGIPVVKDSVAPGKILVVALSFEGVDYGYFGCSVPASLADDLEERRLFKLVSRDISYALHSLAMEAERKLALSELLAAKEEAERANAAKDDFLAVMSHEMRTPLNPIMGYASILQERFPGGEEHDYLGRIIGSSKRLLTLIDDLLDYVRVGEGAVKPVWSSVDLVALCVQAVEDSRSLARDLAVSFVNGPRGSLPMSEGTLVRCDGTMLLRIIDNLLSNAFKYTKQGSVTLELSEGRSEDGEIVRIDVVDTGIGIDLEATPRIFEPFAQADSSYTRQFEGAGLGLAICKQLAEALGGRIEIESELGKGSRFSLILPGRYVEAPEEKLKEESGARGGIGMPLRGRRVLIVEDNQENADMAKLTVEMAGGIPELAPNGRVAVAACKTRRFDVILMDLSMPEMGGLNAAELIRRDFGEKNRCPIIALSAHVTNEDKRRSIEAGMVAHLSKPVHPLDLISSIEAVLADDVS